MGELQSISYTPVEICSEADQSCFTLIPVTIASGLNLPRGQVIGRNTSTGLYEDYDNGANDGTEVASGILAFGVDSRTTGENRPVDCSMYIRGDMVESALTGLDSAAKTDLAGRSIPGRDRFIF